MSKFLLQCGVVLQKLVARFECKEPQLLGIGYPLDHLRMPIFQDRDGVYISMENYIKTMLMKLGIWRTPQV